MFVCLFFVVEVCMVLVMLFYICYLQVGGKKNDLVTRIQGLKAKSLIVPGFALKVLTAGHKKGKPDIMRFQSTTFNYVDRIDLMLAFLSYPFRLRSVHMVLLIYLLRLVEVQTHSCSENEKWDWNGFDVDR